VLFYIQPYYSLILVIIPHISFYSCTCSVPTICVLNLAILPATQTCCSEDEADLEYYDIDL
jgi:hypothetical protein